MRFHRGRFSIWAGVSRSDFSSYEQNYDLGVNVRYRHVPLYTEGRMTRTKRVLKFKLNLIFFYADCSFVYLSKKRWWDK